MRASCILASPMFPCLPAPASASLWQGALLAGRFAVEEWIDSGTQGQVSRARDLLTGRAVAIKQFQEQAVGVREARLLAGLTHPALPAFVACCTDEDAAYLIMDYLDGEPLRRWTPAGGWPTRHLSLPELFRVGRQLCAVLRYLHGRQPPLAHQDLHCQNVLRAPDGSVRVVDFGSAVLVAPWEASRVLGQDISSLRYLLANLLAPEAPGALAWRLRGSRSPHDPPETVQELEEDLAHLSQEVLVRGQ